MKTYDDGESYSPGDPEEIDLVAVEKLQHEMDRIESIENPIEKATAVEELMKVLDNG